MLTGPGEPDAQAVADVGTRGAILISLPSIGGVHYAHERALVRSAGDDVASKVSPTRDCTTIAAADFPHLTFDLVRGVFLSYTASAIWVQLAEGLSGGGMPRQRGLDQALGDEIGKAAVRRGRVRVVSHREPEMSGRVVAGESAAYSPRPSRRMTLVDKYGKVSGAAFLRRSRNSASAIESAAAGSFSLRLGQRDDALPALRRAYDAAQRRKAVGPGNRAVAPLAAIMKSSISDFARFGFSARGSCKASPSNSSRPRWSRARARHARARALERLRDAVLERTTSIPGTAAGPPAEGLRSQTRRQRRFRRASPGYSPARGRLRRLVASPSRETANSITTARRSS